MADPKQAAREPTNAAIVEVLRHNWRAEKEGAQVYRDLAEAESDVRRRTILLRLAEAEEHHAARWAKRLEELGAEIPAAGENLRTRMERWINKHLGTAAAIQR